MSRRSEVLELRTLLTTVLIDYSLDTGNFFDTQDKRDLLQTVADSLASRLTDNLTAITPGPSGFGFDNTWDAVFDHPGTGSDHFITDLTIPADTIRIYAGGRDLPGSTVGLGGFGGFSGSGTQEFLDLVAARGQAGALDSPETDFGPWGGAITFDTLTDWHFGVTTDGLDSDETDFLSVAQHELGHLLGIGTAGSWDAQIVGSDFTGPASVAVYGGPVPLNEDLSHWDEDVTSNGQPATLTPSLLNGTRALFTDLDFAALSDIGWEVVQMDYGDAPDSGTGTKAGDYETMSMSGGPSHVIVAGLFLGNSVDSDSGTVQNAAADADDQFLTGGSDDEDGVLSPLDLLGTVGAAPTITLLATNTTGTAATLYGWIDYNQDGVFDNTTERASIAVPDNTTDGRFTLTFPAIPEGSTGQTYARFRLSTDSAAADSTGAADDGEVEDYPFELALSTDGTVSDSLKYTRQTNGFSSLLNMQVKSFTAIGDLDGDGIGDFAAGSGGLSGRVTFLFMNANNTIKSSTVVSHDLNGGPSLTGGSGFGRSIAALGDINGDGVNDLAVGAYADEANGELRGAVFLLFMNSDGTVQSSTRISSGTGGGPSLADRDYFGASVAGIGDLDGDGITDLAVGARGDNTGFLDAGTYALTGAVHVLFLNANGTVKSSVKIANNTGGGPELGYSDSFGVSVSALGDLDGDGVGDLAVGAYGDNTGATLSGSAYILFMNTNGTAKSSTKIASDTNGMSSLVSHNGFGYSIAGIGDIDGDGIADMAVSAPFGDSQGVYILFLTQAGTVLQNRLITGSADDFWFGASVSLGGDRNADGVSDLLVVAAGNPAMVLSGQSLNLLFLRGRDSETITLIEPGSYEVLVDADDLVVRASGGAELLRRGAGFVTELTINGSSGNDVVTVLDTGTAVTVPLVINGGGGDDTLDASLTGGSVTLNGDEGADLLVGGTLADVLDGGEGNDFLTGGAESDVIGGGAGVDMLMEEQDFSMVLSGDSTSGTLQMTLVNGAVQASDELSSIEAASLRGGTSHNRINASAWISPSITTLIGGGGRDTVIGSPGRDRITTFSSGRDSIQGGDGNDTISTGNGDDTIDGGEGNDSIQGQGGNDSVIGGNGDDNLAGSEGNDTVLGQDGNDKLFGLQENDLLDGGLGNDSLIGSAGDDTLLGGAGKDLLRGDAGTDSINGGGGVDRIDEQINADVTIVGTQIQSVVLGNESPVGIERILLTGGSSGNLFNARLATVEVLLTGNGGNDTLLGGSGNDSVRGNDGNDVLSGGGGTDVIEGGAGTDFWFESADVNFTVAGLQVSSTATGSETGVDIERIAIEGGAGNNNLNASGTTVPVLLLGGLGNDTLLGGSGNDTLTGGFRGDTTVAGSDGIDSLDGGAGADTLKNDPSDTLSNTGGDTLQADVFSLLPDWLDLI